MLSRCAVPDGWAPSSRLERRTMAALYARAFVRLEKGRWFLTRSGSNMLDEIKARIDARRPPTSRRSGGRTPLGIALSVPEP